MSEEAVGCASSARRGTRHSKRARHVFCPSSYLRDVALRWGLDAGRVTVLPNPAPAIPAMPTRDELRAELGLDGDVLVFAGRLGPQKAVGVLLDALVHASGVSLVIAGDGPERSALERRALELGLDARVRFLGSVPRETVLRLFRAADASVLPSAWENFPHTVVEALAVGCPVIATAVGGVPEVVRDGENGLLVPPGDAAALADCDRTVLRRCILARAPARRRCAIRRGLLGGGRLHGDRGGAPEGGRVKKAAAHGRAVAVLASAVSLARPRSSTRSRPSSTFEFSRARVEGTGRTRVSSSCARSGHGRSTERRSTRFSRSAWHVSCARSGRTPCSLRARRRRRSACSDARSRASRHA